LDLSSAEREALDRLLPRDRQTGDLVADLVAATQEAWRRRQQNTVDGGHVIAALYRDTKSWRTLSYLTKYTDENGEVQRIPVSTARRWSIPPGQAEAQVPTTFTQEMTDAERAEIHRLYDQWVQMRSEVATAGESNPDETSEEA